MPDFDEQVQAFERMAKMNRQDCPDQLTTGGYYNTIISGAIAAFGWDMLLMANNELVSGGRPADAALLTRVRTQGPWMQLVRRALGK